MKNLIIALILLFPFTCGATEYYVSGTASGANDGSSWIGSYGGVARIARLR